MCFLKNELKNLLNKKIIQDFADIVSKKPLCDFLLNRAFEDQNREKFKVDLYSLLFSFINNIFKTIDEIDNLDGIYCEKDLLLLFNCINRLYEGINVITSHFKWIKFEYKNKQLFFDNLQLFWKEVILDHNGEWLTEMDNFLIDDNSNFVYYRALLFHPFSTSRHPYIPNKNMKDHFKNYRFTQNALKFLMPNTMSWAFSKLKEIKKNKYPIYIKIDLISALNLDTHENIMEKNNFPTYHLCLDLNDLINYLKGKYESIISATKTLIDKNNELIEKANFKDTWSNNNYEFLEQIINLLDKNFIDSIDFKRLLDQYNLFLNNGLINDNNEILKEYFDEVFITIRKNISYLENYKYQEEFTFFELINNLSYSKPILDKYSYQLEKIFSYLYGERKGIIPVNNSKTSSKQCAINESLVFYNYFAKEYIKMNIFDKNLSFSEIRLLFYAAMWKYNNEKC